VNGVTKCPHPLPWGEGNVKSSRGKGKNQKRNSIGRKVEKKGKRRKEKKQSAFIVLLITSLLETWEHAFQKGVKKFKTGYEK